MVGKYKLVWFDWQVRSLLSSTNLASLSPISILYLLQRTMRMHARGVLLLGKNPSTQVRFYCGFTDAANAADSVAGSHE